MATDDGRAGGSGVVDTDTKVYGTDNLFVVDASIIPAIMTSDPAAMVAIIAEHAFDRISALRPPTLLQNGQQCGGNDWTGSFACAAGLACNPESPSVARVRFSSPPSRASRCLYVC